METEIVNELDQSKALLGTKRHKETILEMDTVNKRNRSARKEMEDYNKMRLIICVTAIDYEFVNALFRKITQEYKTQGEAASVYLFNWNDFPHNGTGNLIEFLMHKFKMDWVKSARLEKSDNGRIIRIIGEGNSISLRLKDKNIVNLKLGGCNRIYKLTAKRENGKINVYSRVKSGIAKRGYGPKIRHVMTFLREHAVYDDRDIQEFAGRFVGTEL